MAFGHGSARKEVLVDIGTEEEEWWSAERGMERFREAVGEVFGASEDEGVGLVDRTRGAVVKDLFI